jgi:hypothetical protein
VKKKRKFFYFLKKVRLEKKIKDQRKFQVLKKIFTKKGFINQKRHFWQKKIQKKTKAGFKKTTKYGFNM